MKEVVEVSFGYMWRIGVLDASYLNCTEFKNDEGKWEIKYHPNLENFYPRYSQHKVYLEESEPDKDGIVTSDILNKEEIKSWFIQEDLKYPKLLDK